MFSSLVVILLTVGLVNLAAVPLNKRCDNGYILNDSLECVTKSNCSSINITGVVVTQPINQTEMSSDICITTKSIY